MSCPTNNPVPQNIEPLIQYVSQRNAKADIDAIVHLFENKIIEIDPANKSAVNHWIKTIMGGTPAAVRKALESDHALLAHLLIQIGGLRASNAPGIVPVQFNTMTIKLALNGKMISVIDPHMRALLKQQGISEFNVPKADKAKMDEYAKIVETANDIIFNKPGVNTSPHFDIATKVLKAIGEINESLGRQPQQAYLPVLLKPEVIKDFRLLYNKTTANGQSEAHQYLSDIIYDSMDVRNPAVLASVTERAQVSTFLADAILSFVDMHKHQRNLGGRGLFYHGTAFKLNDIIDWIDTSVAKKEIPAAILTFMESYRSHKFDTIGEIGLDLTKDVPININGAIKVFRMMDFIDPNIISGTEKHVSLYAGWNELRNTIWLPTGSITGRMDFRLSDKEDLNTLEYAINQYNEKLANPLSKEDLVAITDYLKNLIKVTTDELPDGDLQTAGTARKFLEYLNRAARVGLLGGVAASAVTELAMVAAAQGVTKAMMNVPSLLYRTVAINTRQQNLELSIKQITMLTGLGLDTELGSLVHRISKELGTAQAQGRYAHLLKHADKLDSFIINRLYMLSPVTDALVQVFIKEYLYNYKNVLMGGEAIRTANLRNPNLNDILLNHFKSQGKKFTLYQEKRLQRFMSTWKKDATTGKYSQEMNWQQFVDEMAEIRKHSKLDITKSGIDDIDFNFEAWDKNVLEGFRNRMVGIISDAIQYRDAASIPMWMNFSMGRALTTLLTYPTQAWTYRTVRSWEEGLTSGYVLRGVFTGIALGILMTELLGQIRHGNAPMKDDFDPSDYNFVGGLTRAPHLSYLPSLWFMIGYLTGNTDQRILDKYYLFQPGDYDAIQFTLLPAQQFIANNYLAMQKGIGFMTNSAGIQENDVTGGEAFVAAVKAASNWPLIQPFINQIPK